MKVLHLESDQYSTEALEQLTTSFDLTRYNCTTQYELVEYLKTTQFDVIFTRLGLSIDHEIMDLQPQLKYIATATTGLNHIDVDAANKRGITLISLKGEEGFLSRIKSTAEHTWALLLALMRHLKAATKSVENGHWDRLPFMCDELDGKTLGIIGFGRLGKIVARYGEAFGMRVLVYDKNTAQYAASTSVVPVSIDELLANSDVVLLMIAFSTENRLFMDAAKFKQMKPSAYFVNTSRGELVDETALLEALTSQQLKAAALDVLNNDSAWDGKVQGSNPLIQYAINQPNLLITPHIGGFGRSSIARTRDFITHKLIDKISKR